MVASGANINFELTRRMFASGNVSKTYTTKASTHIQINSLTNSYTSATHDVPSEIDLA